MDHTVFFADKSVVFTRVAPAGGFDVLLDADRESVSRTKICKILETNNSVVVVAFDPEVAWQRFAADFTQVEAAGGVVENERGEWLMIRRNGRWDLPKGHIEPGESSDACAEREIAEETGVEAHVVRPLCSTLHAYWFPKTARWELKRTHWFFLRAAAVAQELRPQQEEGIVDVEWCGPARLAECLHGAFPTIRSVAAAMGFRVSER